MNPVKYGWAVGVLVVALAASAFAAVKVETLPNKIATQANVASVAGDQNLVAYAESEVTQSIESAYGTVQSYDNKKAKVVYTDGGNTAYVHIYVTSDVYTGTVTVVFHKSNWNAQKISTP